MANIIIKNDERKARNEMVARQFRTQLSSSEKRDAVEVIAEKSYEAIQKMKRMEGK